MKRNGKVAPENATPRSHWREELDWAYSQAVYPQLARKYPNRWIAIARHRVVASGTKMMNVLAQARRKVEWDEIPLVFVERGIHVYAFLLHGA